jgi:hypothetical protein
MHAHSHTLLSTEGVYAMEVGGLATSENLHQ